MSRLKCLGGASLAILALTSPSFAQDAIPDVTVTAPKPTPASQATKDSTPGTSQSGAGLGGRFSGYAVNPAAPALGSKGDTPILTTPQNIEVVTRQAMDDRQDITVKDAIVGYVSAVQPPSVTSDSNNFYDGFNIRGFDNANIYRNDLRVWEITDLETANLQSIEILKGPNAMLYGRLEPGGIVDLITKRPLDTPYGSIQEQVDSWGSSRTTLDWTGPLTADKDWLYRVNLDYTHADSPTEFVDTKNFFVGPSVTWRPIEQFKLDMDLEYQNTSFVDNANGFPVIGDRPAPIPVTRYLEQPAISVVNPNQQQRELVGYDWTYDLSNNWSVTNRFAYNNIDYRQFEGLSSGFDPTTDLLSLSVWDARVSAQSLATNLDLKGNFDTGPLHHEVLVGADYWYLDKNIDAYYGANPTVPSLNIFSPSYVFSGYAPAPYDSWYSTRESWVGTYAQDMISLFDDKVHVLLGGRYDWASLASGYSYNSDAEAWGPYNPGTGLGLETSHDQEFSPRLGIVLQPMSWLSVYGNYTKSFGATNGLPQPGAPAFGPEQAVQWEGGVKAETSDKRMMATLAYFDITKSNILAPIGGTPYSTPIGLVDSKGVELDVAGRINDNWSLTASYVYDDARIVNGQGPSNATGATISEDGNWLMDVPQNAGSLWVKYDAMGALNGLSLGAGVVAVGVRQGDNQNDFQLPGYARVDAMISYHFAPASMLAIKNLTAQLNVVNLLNTVYYQSSSSNLNIFPGAPRTVLATLRAEF